MFVTKENGYIVAFGKAENETANEEYKRLQEAMKSKPIPMDGYEYRLKEDLTWELFKLPEVTETDEPIEKAVTDNEP